MADVDALRVAPVTRPLRIMTLGEPNEKAG